MKDSSIFWRHIQTCTDSNHVTMLPTQLVAFVFYCDDPVLFVLFQSCCFVMLFVLSFFFQVKFGLENDIQSFCFHLRMCLQKQDVPISPSKGYYGHFHCWLSSWVVYSITLDSINLWTTYTHLAGYFVCLYLYWWCIFGGNWFSVFFFFPFCLCLFEFFISGHFCWQHRECRSWQGV